MLYSLSLQVKGALQVFRSRGHKMKRARGKARKRTSMLRSLNFVSVPATEVHGKPVLAKANMGKPATSAHSCIIKWERHEY